MTQPLLFKRQFLLSSSAAYSFREWINIRLNESIHLSVHPDLEVVQSFANNIRLTLLGFVVDPFSPDKSNKQILDDVASNASSFEEVVANTNALGGRWIILFQYNNTFRIFHDPCGLRRVYYYKDENGFMCGSDPAIINHFVKLKEDKSKELQDFINSPKFFKAEHCWIGSDTIYVGVKHLMPNHYLDLHQWKAVRYWPNERLERMELMEAVNLAARMLQGSILAASKRQPLVLAVTAGWDSRVLLAASREISDNVTYFISVSADKTKDPLDVVIPSKLFKKLQIPFKVQRCGEVDDTEFLFYFRNNIAKARKSHTRFIYKYYNDFKGRLNVNGNGSETVRIIAYPILPVKMNGAALASLGYIGYKDLSYAASQFDLWLKDIHPLCSACGYNILDILYWEQRMGNWGALYPAEQDIAIDQISPFNNRLLLTTMLSVDAKHRIYPKYTLYTKIIEKLWPELLCQPISPESMLKKTKHLIKQSVMNLTGVY